MRRRDFLSILSGLGTCAFASEWLTRATFAVTPSSAPQLDAHTHVFGPAFVAALRSLVDTPEIKDAITTVEGREVVALMNRMGTQRALLLSTAGVLAGDDPAWPRMNAFEERRAVRDENDFTAAQAAAASGRLIPFASVNPTRTYAVEEVIRCIDVAGMRGVALQFGNGVRLHQPRHLQKVRMIFECAAERNVPMIVEFYNRESNVPDEAEIDLFVSRLIAPVSQLRVVVAHLASRGADRHADEALAALLDAIKRHPEAGRRVWLDCSSVFMEMAFPPGAAASAERLARLGSLLRTWPADRLLWGSDNTVEALDEARRLWPLSDAAWQTLAQADASALFGHGVRAAGDTGWVPRMMPSHN